MAIGFLMVIGGAAALSCVAIVVYLVSIFNGIVMLRKNIDKSWANIDVILKQRYDELPRLIEVCKGYMDYEKSILKFIAESREKWVSAGAMGQKARVSGEISGGLKSLFAIAEFYPDLKANTTFLELQKRISDLENQLADRREFYNDSVNNYNTRIHSIPDMWMAGAMHYQPVELFKATEQEKQLVEVKLQ